MKRREEGGREEDERDEKRNVWSIHGVFMEGYSVTRLLVPYCVMSES